MCDRSKFGAVVIFATLALATACASDANRNQPVTTTTNTGSSTAPPASQVEERDNALVRVIHAIPGGAAVDVFADNTKAFSSVAYKTVTPYQELPEEQDTFSIRPAGLDTAEPLAQADEGLDEGQRYTVIAHLTDDGKGAGLRVINDDLKMPSAGQARVRVIHASPDAGNVDVYVQGRDDDDLFDGVEFGGGSGYEEVEPMTATLEVRPAGQRNTMLTLPNVRFEAGKNYTIVLAGRARTAPKLEAIIVEDQIGGATTPTGAASPTGTATNR
ncbi:hypothetical protein BH18ACI2_BH18ACI2_22310 [soil metagenome]